ncbi:MAG: 1-acyl-sn-glycerol-3-phosphate acyltransferase [Deltaproteobacteria bacterium]|nr:1-acyl-sn-glycerol-3-phosphate acyltransferase [Deltaproteobacteria bacterium]
MSPDGPPPAAADEAPPDVPEGAGPPAALAERVRSAAAWSAGLAWGVPWMLGLTVGHRVLPRRWMRALEVPFVWGLLRAVGARMHYHVDRAVDPRRPYMFVQNHVNHFDFVVLHNAVPHFTQGMNLRKHFRYPVYGWFMRARGTLAVDETAGQFERLKGQMAAELAAGRSLLVFPEGHRTRTGRVGPLRSGVFRLARDLGVPVVPVSVVGTYDLMRKGSLEIRPGREVHVHVFAPRETAGLSDERLPELVEDVRRELSGPLDAWWVARGDGKRQARGRRLG